MASKYELVDFDSLDPSNPPYHCVGIAPSTRPQRRCHNSISKSNMDTAGVWIKKIANQRTTTLDELERIAGLCLCQRNHQNQAKTVARNWYNDIKQNNITPPILTSQTTTVSATSACNSSQSTIQPVTSSTASDSIEHLQRLIADLQIARQTITSRDTKISALLTELETLKTAYQTFKDHNTNLVHDSLNQTSQIRASRRTILQLEQEVADNNTQISNLKDEAKITGRKLRRFERAVEDFKHEKSILEDNNTDLRASYVMLSQSSSANTSRLTRELKDSQTQNEELNTKVSTLESEVETRASREQDLEDKITKLETELNGASEKAQQLDSKLRSLTSALESSAEAQKDSKSQISTLLREAVQNQTLTTKISTLETSLSQAEDVNRTQAATAAEAAQQATLREHDLNTRISTLTQELEDSKEEENHLEARITYLRQELRIAVESAEELEKQVGEMSQEFAEERQGWEDRSGAYERMVCETRDRGREAEGRVQGLEEQLREERCGYFTGLCRES